MSAFFPKPGESGDSLAAYGGGLAVRAGDGRGGWGGDELAEGGDGEEVGERGSVFFLPL